MTGQPSPYLIEKILPSGRIHLLAGISSAGKTRWILPTLLLWQTGAPVLGLRSFPEPWGMVCGDRPLIDAHDSLRTMNFSPEAVPIIPCFGKYNKPLGTVLREIEKAGWKLIFWEGFDMFVRNPNNPSEVRELLSTVGACCEELGWTVLGTVGVPKLKPSETYLNPRQLVGGTTLWERATSTNFIIQPTNPRNVGDGSRMLHVCLKNAPSFAVTGCFDHNGALIFNSWDHRLEDEELQKLLTDLKKRPKSAEE